MNFTPIIAANWKMHKTPNESVKFYKDLKGSFESLINVEIILSVPFTSLNSFNAEPPFFKAAQNCHWEDSGAYTGEISVQMIKEFGTEYVIDNGYHFSSNGNKRTAEEYVYPLIKDYV